MLDPNSKEEIGSAMPFICPRTPIGEILSHNTDPVSRDGITSESMLNLTCDLGRYLRFLGTTQYLRPYGVINGATDHFRQNITCDVVVPEQRSLLLSPRNSRNRRIE